MRNERPIRAGHIGSGEGELDGLTLAEGERVRAGELLAFGRSQAVGSGYGCVEGGFYGPVVFPGEIDEEASSRAESGDAAFGPGGGERGQKVDFSGVALQEHFGDPGYASERAIDLFGPAKKIGDAILTETASDHFVSLVRLAQTGSQGDQPGVAPARFAVRGSDGAAVESGGDSFSERGRAAGRELRSGEQAEKGRLMAVPLVGFLEIFAPFLELSEASDFGRWKFGERGFELLA